jgi:hypothetical protein
MSEQKRITVNLAELKKPVRNVRMHPEKQVQEIIKSLDMFGQCRDIVIDENNTVLAGNGLWEAMTRRGDIKAAAIRLTGLSEKEKLKFMLADNKTFSLGVEDLDGINAVLEQLGAELDVPGYDEETLRALVATGAEVTEKLNTYGTINDDEIESIRANAAGKESLMENAQQPPDEEQDDVTDESAEVRKSVICPKCGELIWL